MWATPKWLFDILNHYYQFTLDVCAIKENAKCAKFFSPEDDGLNQKWEGICWMNPPYGREIKKWVKKAHDSAKKGSAVVALLPARTDTAWFWDYIHGKTNIEFIRGRLKFNDGKGAAPFPSMIVVWEPDNLYPQDMRMADICFGLACSDIRQGRCYHDE
jgi:phage N-6-adenine-methyltransferase